MAGLRKAAKGREGELEGLGELAEESCGAGEVGRLRGGMVEGWEGRIRAVQWEANPKAGMEGEAGGVDKMSCRRLWDRSENDSAWLGEL